jgi:hypothetical protein
MNTLKPGWQTTEFWITLAGQILALCVALRFVPAADAEQLQGSLSTAITAIFAFVTSAATIAHYVSSRAHLKERHLDQAAPKPPEPDGPPKLFSALAAAVFLTLLALPGPGMAAEPRQPTCLFGCQRQRQTDPQMTQLLQQIIRQNEQIIALLQQQPVPPAAPQYIILGPQPLQTIPLGGLPRQDIPLGGPPRQDIPLGGPPRQDIPLGPPPAQNIPLGPPPLQQIPLQQPRTPAQPAAPVPPANPMPGATGFDRYTRVAIWKPAP